MTDKRHDELDGTRRILDCWLDDVTLRIARLRDGERREGRRDRQEHVRLRDEDAGTHPAPEAEGDAQAVWRAVLGEALRPEFVVVGIHVPVVHDRPAPHTVSEGELAWDGTHQIFAISVVFAGMKYPRYSSSLLSACGTASLSIR